MLTFPSAPNHVRTRHKISASKRKSTFFRQQNWLFSNLSPCFRCVTSLTSLVTSSIWDFYFDISEWHIRSAHAWTPALMLHLTNPCAKRKVPSLTKPKGKIYKTKSLGHYITAIQNGGKSNCAPGLNRGLPSNLWWLRCANQMKFTEEYVMCMEIHVLVKKTFTNGLNMGLPLQARGEKTVYGVETYWLSGKENILGATVSKESHADDILGHERTHDYWFPWKRCNCKQCFSLPIP